MTWIYESREITEIPDEYAGFVYLITNKLTGRMYIGKKLSKSSKTTYKTETLKNGKKRRKKIRGKIESDWQTYWGSSPELARDIEQLGTENFQREILYYCRSKAECSYIEAREQFLRKVLESDDYYNGIINCRIHGSHIKGKLGNNGLHRPTSGALDLEQDSQRRKPRRTSEHSTTTREDDDHL